MKACIHCDDKIEVASDGHWCGDQTCNCWSNPNGSEHEPGVTITISRKKDWNMELDAIAELEEGWFDGQGARSATPAVDMARAVCELLTTADLSSPRPYPLEEGGIRLEWTIDGSELVVEVEADGDLEMFVVGDILIRRRLSVEATTEAGEEV